MHRPSAPSNMETNDNPTRSSKPADTNSKNKRSRDDDENAVSSGRSVSEEHDEDVAARSLESKRAYNRMISARARQRQKNLVNDLNSQLESHLAKQQDLQQENNALKSRIAFLEGENQLLRAMVHSGTNMGQIQRESVMLPLSASIASLAHHGVTDSQVLERLLSSRGDHTIFHHPSPYDDLQKRLMRQPSSSLPTLGTSSESQGGQQTPQNLALLQLLQQQQQQHDARNSYM